MMKFTDELSDTSRLLTFDNCNARQPCRANVAPLRNPYDVYSGV